MSNIVAKNAENQDLNALKTASLIFPHHLFENSPLIELGHTVFIVEEYLFFNQYAFHKQKLAFHRASMQFYADFLASKNMEVIYINAWETHSDIRNLIPHLGKQGITKVYCYDPVDDWLSTRIKKASSKTGIELKQLESPLFLNTNNDLAKFFRKDKKKFFQTSFYKEQRLSSQILLDEENKPIGGKWSFDADNRKKFPKGKTPPPVQYPKTDQYYQEALSYVDQYFSNNPGERSDFPLYPYNFASAKAWLTQFLEIRFHEFGPYEDAILKDFGILNHSVLTPMLNVGLITPQAIVNESLKFGANAQVPINSLEGFIRQVIGWREFIRGVYIAKGGEERTRNFWNFNRKIPSSFYDGTTGILPVDDTIKKVLKTGYCHHIERLMVLGNFMLLCEFDPDEVYRWFMELFIDAYDWVMVPNVYGMSQFADGGLMSTKPYISSSNYILKMSDYQKGTWQATWDGLFWRFMHLQRDFFLQNPRLGMLIRTFDKMPGEKQKSHLDTANQYLATLDQ
ncbi:MAG: cryptochrome/photolyase family protein [Bacteroidota bacterium]